MGGADGVAPIAWNRLRVADCVAPTAREKHANLVRTELALISRVSQFLQLLQPVLTNP